MNTLTDISTIQCRATIDWLLGPPVIGHFFVPGTFCSGNGASQPNLGGRAPGDEQGSKRAFAKM